MITQSVTAIVPSLPLCDICGSEEVERPAVADARVPQYGSWANLCLEHFVAFGCQVGLGNGQQLISSKEDQ